MKNILNIALFGEQAVQKSFEAAMASKAKVVVFIDQPAKAESIKLISFLQKEGKEVIYLDHHRPEVNDSSTRAEEIRKNIKKLEELLPQTVIKTRSEHPACSSLLETGEFSNDDYFVIADADLDGLLGAMKAKGAIYDSLDNDAAILDGPASKKNRENGLSLDGELLVKGLATLPPFNPKFPSASVEAKEKLFESFTKMIQGESEARKTLESKVADFDRMVEAANIVANSATQTLPGVWIAEMVGQKPDLATLSSLLEGREGCKITVMRKDSGPIAALHDGVQYSLCVKKEFQEQIDIRQFIPEGIESSPATGLISNTSFLLHCSESVWNEVRSNLKKL
ncbi:MAG: hypothetical protein GY828_02475 [Candidatus Gracilibacteria bacterium]|nr:hypothetical protein [Candidatus Gracilibacteria bacterium]